MMYKNFDSTTELSLFCFFNLIELIVLKVPCSFMFLQLCALSMLIWADVSKIQVLTSSETKIAIGNGGAIIYVYI